MKDLKMMEALKMFEIDLSDLIPSGGNLVRDTQHGGLGCGDTCNGVICGGACHGGYCGYSMCGYSM